MELGTDRLGQMEICFIFYGEVFDDFSESPLRIQGVLSLGEDAKKLFAKRQNNCNLILFYLYLLQFFSFGK